MKKSACVIENRPSKVWTAIKIILIVVSVCVIAAKIYQKFSKKKKETVADCNDATDGEIAPCADCAAAPVAPAVADAVLELPAEAVIVSDESAE